MVNRNWKPFHMEKSQHLHLRRPRNLLKSQQRLSINKYNNQTRMAPNNQNQNLSYE
jgi:hypothetical protein